MRKITSLFIVLISVASTAQIVNIPDAALKTKLLNYTPIIDTNANGEIEVAEAAVVTQLDFGNNTNSIANLTGIEAFTNLVNLYVREGNLTTVDISALTNLKRFSCRHNDVTSINFGGISLKYLDCNGNELTSIDLSGQTQLESLDCGDNNLTSLDLSSCFSTLSLLLYRANNITSLPYASLTHLHTLDCSYNGISSIDVSMLTNLQDFKCSANNLTSLNVAPLVNLRELFCDFNNLSTVDISTLSELNYYVVSNNPIGSIDISTAPLLQFLECRNTNITSIDVSMLPDLEALVVEDNPISSLDLSQNPKMFEIMCRNTLLTTLDFSYTTNPNPHYVDFSDNPNLESVNVKNNSSIYDWVVTYGCPNLKFICADESDILDINMLMEQDGTTGVQVNTYCSFTPGGSYNTIAGVATFDSDNNGCGGSDPVIANVKMGIDDGTTSGATFTIDGGDYSFFTQAGNYTVTPLPGNSYFTITPASATLNFPLVDSSTQTQPFCFAANGVHNDLEIAIIPPFPPRPGFDTSYRILYINKGNQTLSGTVNFAFDDNISDFVSATPPVTTQSVGNLAWNFTNMLPFERRYIDVRVNLNSPIETPPVNNNDLISVTATANPIAGDETPADNVVTLNETAVGSFDPNDKTCLEGNTIAPEKVGDYLHYLIRFQNTGTASAINVVVKDMIDETKFDISSLELVGSSHPQTTRITDNRVEFIFENINLPAQQNDEPGSHGYVAFKIKTKNTLVLGDSVENKADIFFDFNAPITTDPAVTTVEMLGVGEFENTSVSVSPNPVKNVLNISAKDNISSIQLFDIQGRLLQTSLENHSDVVIDLSRKTSGVYFVKVTTDKGIKVQKIIKE